MANDDDKKAAEAAAKDHYRKGNSPQEAIDYKEGFLAGIAYLRNELMKGAGEFDEALATSGYLDYSEETQGSSPHQFVSGARWAHEQSRLREAALLAEVDELENALGRSAIELGVPPDGLRCQIDRLKRELAECYEGKAALVEDVQGYCLDLEKAERELAAKRPLECIMCYAEGPLEVQTQLTAERERAKGLVEKIAAVLSQEPPELGAIKAALAAYQNKENK